MSNRILTIKQFKGTEPWYPSLRMIERIVILRRLREMKQHREMTAKTLGISVRKLYYKIQEYRL